MGGETQAWDTRQEPGHWDATGDRQWAWAQAGPGPAGPC